MCSYISKDEGKWSQAMKQVFKEAIESGAVYYEQMKSLAYSSASKRGCYLQKAVYYIMSELQLEKDLSGACDCWQ